MTTYVDSSVLVAVYVSERFSKAARQVVRAAPQIPFTQLHDLEVRDAFELLVGRNLIRGKSVGRSKRSWMTTSKASGLRECPWIWTACSRAQLTSHERTPPDFSLGAWTCCTWQPRE